LKEQGTGRDEHQKRNENAHPLGERLTKRKLEKKGLSSSPRATFINGNVVHKRQRNALSGPGV